MAGVELEIEPLRLNGRGHRIQKRREKYGDHVEERKTELYVILDFKDQIERYLRKEWMGGF